MDIAAICRLCLGNHDSINVLSYLDGKTKLLTVLNHITGIIYPEFLELPRNVCEACFDKARETYLFQQACRESLDEFVRISGEEAEDVSPATSPKNAKPPANQKKAPTKAEPVIVETVIMSEEDSDEEEEEGELYEEEEIPYDEEEEEPKFQVADAAAVSPTHDSKKRTRSPETKPSGSTKITSSPHPKRTYQCIDCDTRFETLQKLTVHTKSVHEKKGDIKIYICPKCNQKFDSGTNLKSHETKCAAQPKPFSCNVCQERFSYPTELKVHKANHDVEKRFFCPDCNKKFTRSSQVKLHQRSHTQEKPFECDVCGVGFAKKTNMVRHMATHDTENKFCCSICEKSFKWETSLKVHLNTHSRTRMYKCEHCSKDYSSQSGYRKHLRVAHSAL